MAERNDKINHGRTSPAALRRAEMQRRAVMLRVTGGMSYRVIAGELGCSPTTAYRLVAKQLDATPQETSAQLRSLVLERLNLIYGAHVRQIQEPAHARILIQAVDAVAKIAGLYADGADLPLYDSRGWDPQVGVRIVASDGETVDGKTGAVITPGRELTA